MKRILILQFIFVCLLMPALAQKSGVPSQKEAVAIAERFVAERGYTDDSPVGTYEIIKGQKRKSNLIERQAIIAFVIKTGEHSVWSVRFLLKEQDYKNQQKTEQKDSIPVVITYDYGREVRLSLDGKKVWMEKKLLPVKEASLFGDCTGNLLATKSTAESYFVFGDNRDYFSDSRYWETIKENLIAGRHYLGYITTTL